MEMNLQILTQTKIGYSVHALKKSSKNDETVSKAKSLIKSWRKFVPDENPKKGNHSSSSTKSNKMDTTAKSSKSSSNVDLNGTYVYDGSVLDQDEEVRKRIQTQYDAKGSITSWKLWRDIFSTNQVFSYW